MKHISPALQQLELQSFGKSVKVHGNMEVRVYSGVSEISVVYKVDEFSIELFIHLPTSYPPPLERERGSESTWLSGGNGCYSLTSLSQIRCERDGSVNSKGEGGLGIMWRTPDFRPLLTKISLMKH